jgi:type II secretory pathway pseudopilin PulG
VRTPALAHPIGDRRGITLVEVIVAVGIITIGLSALLAAVPFASYGTREGYQLSTATFLANERLEQVRNARWESEPRPVDELGVSPTPASAPESGATTTFSDEAALPAPYGDYARAVRIIDCGGGGGCGGIAKADLRQVTISVTYRPMTGVGGTGIAKAAAVTTLIARR